MVYAGVTRMVAIKYSYYTS